MQCKYKQTFRQTFRQIDRQTDRQMDRQMNIVKAEALSPQRTQPSQFSHQGTFFLKMPKAWTIMVADIVLMQSTMLCGSHYLDISSVISQLVAKLLFAWSETLSVLSVIVKFALSKWNLGFLELVFGLFSSDFFVQCVLFCEGLFFPPTIAPCWHQLSHMAQMCCCGCAKSPP